jgi:phosphatidylserine decarboxylase
VPKTLNPVWNVVFDVALTPGAESELIEAVCWDRDRFRKDYLGEFGFSISELFARGARRLDDPENEVRFCETVRF